jgi:hypothetical protein
VSGGGEAALPGRAVEKRARDAAPLLARALPRRAEELPDDLVAAALLAAQPRHVLGAPQGAGDAVGQLEVDLGRGLRLELHRDRRLVPRLEAAALLHAQGGPGLALAGVAERPLEAADVVEGPADLAVEGGVALGPAAGVAAGAARHAAHGAQPALDERVAAAEAPAGALEGPLRLLAGAPRRAQVLLGGAELAGGQGRGLADAAQHLRAEDADAAIARGAGGGRRGGLHARHDARIVDDGADAAEGDDGEAGARADARRAHHLGAVLEQRHLHGARLCHPLPRGGPLRRARSGRCDHVLTHGGPLRRSRAPAPPAVSSGPACAHSRRFPPTISLLAGRITRY